jgi:hypothetical protein
MKLNRGCFFCWDVARRATPDEYFMMQDADDWAAPSRAATLLANMLEKDSDLAISAQPQFREAADGKPYQVDMRWHQMSDERAAPVFTVRKIVDENFIYRAPHAGLIRTDALKRIGGYYGGFRIGWDTLLTNLILMTGSISWTPDPLYYRLVRSDSLTHSTSTGAESKYATEVGRCLRFLYQKCYEVYRRYVVGGITAESLARRITAICRQYVTTDDENLLASEARRLGRMMV